MKRVFILILCIAACIAAWSQQIAVRNFMPSVYGYGRQNWSICQDEGGRMLFGNSNGLLVYDGETWSMHYMPNYSSVRSVAYDSRRHVTFVGASNEFGYFVTDAASGNMEYHSLSALLPERQRFFGEIWEIGLTGDKLPSVRFYSKSHMYVVNDDLSKVSVLPWSQAHKQIEALKQQTIRGTARLSNGTTIMATAAGELFTVDKHGAYPYKLDVTPYLMANDVFCMASHGDIIAFGTVRGGVVVKDMHAGTTYYINIQAGLCNNTVLSLYFDLTGNLWAGLDNGVAYLLVAMPQRELFASPLDNIGTGYTSLRIGNTLYLGTNQGLFAVDYSNARGKGMQQRHAVAGLTGQVWRLKMVDGLLLCAADKGAFIVNGDKAERIEGLQGTWNFCPLSRYPGYVLAVDYNGFALLKRVGNRLIMTGRLKGFSEASGSIEEDADGTLWISQWLKGVTHFEVNADLTSTRKLGSYGKGRGLFVDAGNLIVKIDGKVYVSTVDGLYGYNHTTKQLERDKEMSNIFSSFDTSINIVQLDDGTLWAYKSGFLAVALKKNNKWQADKISYMNLASRLQTEFGNVSQIEPGVACFGAGDGFLLIDRNKHIEASHQKPIISRVVAMRHDSDSLLYSYNYAQSIGKTDRVEVAPDNNYLRIEFSLPEYREEKAVVYSVYLEGFDKEWTAYSATSTKEYKLGRGRYIFHVKARNLVNGQESETSLEIKVHPHWYESWYAFVAYAIIAIALTIVVLIYLRRVSMKKLIEEKKEAELNLARARSVLLETKLKHRTSELADSTMNIAHNNEILQQIDARLAELSESVRREDAKADITKAIANISDYIQHNIDNDDHWDKFEENFNFVYDNFIQHLRESYPELKRNELKLCSYLRMNLSSKEIASLMNVSERSIETARYRLRKKLRLNQGDNLIDFLSHC